MSESITITYKPVAGVVLTNSQTMIVTTEQLFGIIAFAYVLLDNNDSIVIKLSNGDIVDIKGFESLPYFQLGYPYSCDLCSTTGRCIPVSFRNNEFIEGVAKLCILLGFDPGSHIINIMDENFSIWPVSRYLQRYYGKLEIPNFTRYSDGTAIHIEMFRGVIEDKLVNTMSSTLTRCFPESQGIGIIIPCNIYIITTDESRSNVISVLAATQFIPDNLQGYNGAYYISSVCTDSCCRGQGLAKSLMITMLNDLISQGVKEFILEVLPGNKSAYKLYSSLGFVKVKTITEDGETFDVLSLKI